MAAKLAIASLLAASSVATAGQEAGAPAGARAMQWPHMHQCTLKAAATGEWSMIDLDVTGSPAGPTITAHAINTKGTGTSGRGELAIKTKGTSAQREARSELAIKTKGTGAQRQASSEMAIKTKGTGVAGRASEVRNQLPIGVDCATSQVTGDEQALKGTAASFAFTQADGSGVGWSCSVSGSEAEPVFRVSLFVPAMLVQTGAGRSEWSWGASNSHGRVSIVPRSAENSANWHVACKSKEPSRAGYDLSLNKF